MRFKAKKALQFYRILNSVYGYLVGILERRIGSSYGLHLDMTAKHNKNKLKCAYMLCMID
jgi:hypothetical protein